MPTNEDLAREAFDLCLQLRQKLSAAWIDWHTETESPRVVTLLRLDHLEVLLEKAERRCRRRARKALVCA